LAVYSDTLLGITSDRIQGRAKLTGMIELVKHRWGVNSIRLGHADDYRDYGLEAEAVMDGIEAECEDMKHSAKDLMVSDRATVEAETLEGARRARAAFLKVTDQDPVFQLLALEQMEGIISNTLGGSGVRAYLACYWNIELVKHA